MILEIDAGNTRTKWRCLHGDAVVDGGVLLTSAASELGADVEVVCVPKAVRLASVADRTVEGAVIELAEKWGAELFIAATTAEAEGVTCAYRDPSAMGVDRWLAVVAAYHQARTDCVVVDAGSAITVDLVDRAGRHLGGYIVPGLRLMNEALWGGTSDVRASYENNRDTAPGCSTPEAVNHGLLLMAKGLIEESINKLPAESPPVVLLTGGDASVLHPVMDGRAQMHPDLVLDGLSLVALSAGDGAG